MVGYRRNFLSGGTYFFTVHFNPVKHGLVSRFAIGRIPRFIHTCGKGRCQRTGAEMVHPTASLLESDALDPTCPIAAMVSRIALRSIRATSRNCTASGTRS